MQITIDRTTAVAEINEIVTALHALPAEKVVEVRDYVWFLQKRYGDPQPVDIGDAWSDEDIGDLTAASLTYATQSFWTDEDDD